MKNSLTEISRWRPAIDSAVARRPDRTDDVALDLLAGASFERAGLSTLASLLRGRRSSRASFPCLALFPRAAFAVLVDVRAGSLPRAAPGFFAAFVRAAVDDLDFLPDAERLFAADARAGLPAPPGRPPDALLAANNGSEVASSSPSTMGDPEVRRIRTPMRCSEPPVGCDRLRRCQRA